jgi:hypothetical protein
MPSVPFVELSTDAAWKAGERVLVTGWGMGESHDGGFTELARVPATWPIRIAGGMIALLKQVPDWRWMLERDTSADRASPPCATHANSLSYNQYPPSESGWDSLIMQRSGDFLSH